MSDPWSALPGEAGKDSSVFESVLERAVGSLAKPRSGTPSLKSQVSSPDPLWARQSIEWGATRDLRLEA
jgi:hypothetical protein